jgi:hypothetical protein
MCCKVISKPVERLSCSIEHRGFLGDRLLSFSLLKGFLINNPSSVAWSNIVLNFFMLPRALGSVIPGLVKYGFPGIGFSQSSLAIQLS